MKPFLLLLSGAACLSCLPLSGLGQDNAARAAALAEREAAEERYKRLNSAVEDLWAAKAEQDRRLAALVEEIRNLRADASKTDPGKYVTREEFNKLIKTVEEIERKREADRKLIEDEFKQLERDLRKMLSAPPPSPSPKNLKSPQTQGKTEKTAGKSADTSAANQEGVWHEIEEGNKLIAIIAAYNEEYKKQGKKTSLRRILDANPGLEPTKMKVGQKIFIPLVPQ